MTCVWTLFSTSKNSSHFKHYSPSPVHAAIGRYISSFSSQKLKESLECKLLCGEMEKSSFFLTHSPGELVCQRKQACICSPMNISLWDIPDRDAISINKLVPWNRLDRQLPTSKTSHSCRLHWLCVFGRRNTSLLPVILLSTHGFT